MSDKRKKEDNRDVFEKALEDERWESNYENNVGKLQLLGGLVGGVVAGGAGGRVLQKLLKPKTYRQRLAMDTIAPVAGGAVGVDSQRRRLQDWVEKRRQDRLSKLRRRK